MTYTNLNPLWLRTFRSLVVTRNFTETARQLHMTQPGVSQHIHKLEAACGCSLIERRDRKPELTHQGEAVYQYALQLEEQEQQLLTSLQNDDPFRGEVTIACSGAQALNLYPELLKVQKQYPALNVRMEAAPNHTILEAILEGNTDCGIVTHFNSDHRYHAKKLRPEELCLVLPAGSPIQKISPERLQNIGLIDHPDAAHYLSLYFAGCGESALQKTAVQQIPQCGYVNQLNQILLPVSEGIGFTVLPKSAVEHFPAKSKIAIYKPKRQVNQSRHLIWKARRQLPARSVKLMEYIQEWLG